MGKIEEVMKILAIDTSCDDTCIAILQIKDLRFKILSNVVSSQVKIHQKYGGVYPTLAKREHEKNLPAVLERALREAKLITKTPRVDRIAVTIGPGLDPCLWTGVNFAKALAHQWRLPIIPVNHIEAHIFANWLITFPGNVIKFPAVCLVVSGGHTQLVLMRGIGDYKIIGETRDDAAGECFDKTARVLGLEYPGGPAIAAVTARLKIKDLRLKINLPRPMINSKNYDFSFSGLKTAVLYNFKKRTKKVRTSKEYVREMAKEIQQAIIDVLIKKTIKVAKDYKAKSIILGGGVAANTELRKQLKNQLLLINNQLNFLVPPKNLCTDNGAMIAMAGYFNRKKATKKWRDIKANANLRINNSC